MPSSSTYGFTNMQSVGAKQIAVYHGLVHAGMNFKHKSQSYPVY